MWRETELTYHTSKLRNKQTNSHLVIVSSRVSDGSDSVCVCVCVCVCEGGREWVAGGTPTPASGDTCIE